MEASVGIAVIAVILLVSTGFLVTAVRLLRRCPLEVTATRWTSGRFRAIAEAARAADQVVSRANAYRTEEGGAVSWLDLSVCTNRPRRCQCEDRDCFALCAEAFPWLARVSRGACSRSAVLPVGTPLGWRAGRVAATISVRFRSARTALSLVARR